MLLLCLFGYYAVSILEHLRKKSAATLKSEFKLKNDVSMNVLP